MITCPHRILVVLGVGTLLAACGGESQPEQPPTRVIFITLDTLRADHLDFYGYGRPTSPELAEFAAGATVYTRAQAAAPWTLPSHASMFTGLYPHEHGAHTWPFESFPGQPEGFINVSPLAEEHVTLAEVFQSAGCATGAVVANVAFMDERFGLSQGFDQYDRRMGRVEAVNERVLGWLDEHGQGPFFLFVNYMDTHSPYNTKPLEDRSLGPLGGDNTLKRASRLVLDPALEAPELLLRQLVNQYDTAIANLDWGLGQLFDELRRRGLYHDTLIVITSDHGEYLGEKDLIEHSKDVYQGALHVPLIVKAPGQTEGDTDTDWISHVHLPGLILDLSLRSLNSGIPIGERIPTPSRAVVLSENYYSRAADLRAPWGARFDRVRRVLVRGDMKFIGSSDGAHELYNLALDPLETVNLLELDTAPENPLAAELDAWLRSRPAAPPAGKVDVDSELLEFMRGLGYAGDDDDEAEAEAETETELDVEVEVEVEDAADD